MQIDSSLKITMGMAEVHFTYLYVLSKLFTLKVEGQSKMVIFEPSELGSYSIRRGESGAIR